MHAEYILKLVSKKNVIFFSNEYLCILYQNSIEKILSFIWWQFFYFDLKSIKYLILLSNDLSVD